MNEAVSSGKDFDERPEVSNTTDNTVVDLADLCCGGAGFYTSHCFLGGIAVGCTDDYSTIIFDIDVGARFFLDGANVLAARTDKHPNLFAIDFRPQQTWGVAACFGTRSWDGGNHLAKDFHAGFFGLLQSSLHDFFGNTIDLQIELDTGDTFRRTSNLEVHVTKVIFVADDVSE